MAGFYSWSKRRHPSIDSPAEGIQFVRQSTVGDRQSTVCGPQSKRSGALGQTRTAKPLRALVPETSVFTNFTTRAGGQNGTRCEETPVHFEPAVPGAERRGSARCLRDTLGGRSFSEPDLIPSEVVESIRSGSDGWLANSAPSTRLRPEPAPDQPSPKQP